MRNVKRREIHELEGSEPESGLLPHDAINIDEVRNSFTDDAKSLRIHRAPGVIDDEAWHVFRAHRRVPKPTRE